jgi:hypothetical protein
MATETLRLDIVADSAQAKAELQKLNNQLAIFEKALKKSTDPAQIIYLNKNIEILKNTISAASENVSGIENLNKSLVKLQNNVQAFGGGVKSFIKPDSFEKLSVSVNGTANSTNKLVKGSNQAAFALTNLGRIAQDAPFGFIGIQNNLNPMLESFQRLQQTTGSVGGALKAMASSLIGPAGLGLALSVASSLLLVFGDRLFKSAQETEKATKFNESYTNSLAKERAQLDLLFQAATNANAPLLARKDAVKELRDNYGAYLKNFSDEEILAGKAATAYTELANAIVMASKARAAQDAIVELQKKSINAEIKLQEIATKAQQDAAKARDIAAKGTQGGFTRAITAEQQRIGIFAAASLEAKKLADEISGINKEINQYAAIALSNQIKPFTEETVKPIRDTATATKKAADEVANYIKELLYLRTIQKQGMRDVSARPVLAGDYSNPEVNISQDMVARTLATQQATKTQLDYANALRLTALEEEKIAMWAGIANNAFMAFQSSLIAGNSVVDSLGEAFKRLAIQIGVSLAKTAALAGIISLLSGGKINFGSAFKLASKYTGALPFAREGGVFSGPSSGYPAILHGTEAVLNPKQFKNLTSNMMNIGAARGGGMMNVQVEGILRGQDIVLQRTRAERALGLRRG